MRPGEGWFLESIMIRAPEGGGRGQLGEGGLRGGGGSGREYHFHCARWLDAGQDDQKTVRELYPVEGSSCKLDMGNSSVANI